MSTTIRVEDAYPRPGARQVDDALVAAIAAGMEVVGFLPSEPVLVRRSGNRYVVIDGQQRIAAARTLGIEEVPAVIEDVDEAHALTYEGALNVQRPDTEQERWARAQDFFDLEDAGAPADPAMIHVATGLDAEKQAVVRRVRRVVNDREAMVDQHSFDRILAIDEFLDDPDAVHRLLNASERDWRLVYARERFVHDGGTVAVSEAAGEPIPANDEEAEYLAVIAFIATDVTRRPHLRALMEAEADALLSETTVEVHGMATRLAAAWLIDMAKRRMGDPKFTKALKADGYERSES